MFISKSLKEFSLNFEFLNLVYEFPRQIISLVAGIPIRMSVRFSFRALMHMPISLQISIVDSGTHSHQCKLFVHSHNTLLISLQISIVVSGTH